MELTAAIEALAALKGPSAVDFYTDSQYVRGGVTGWIAGWKRNGWKTADRKPVKNIDLWQQLDALRDAHDITWHWVKGHAGTARQRARRRTRPRGHGAVQAEEAEGNDTGGMMHALGPLFRKIDCHMLRADDLDAAVAFLRRNCSGTS